VPDLLGLAHEALLAADDRRARGAHYTPERLAARLVGLALDGLDARRIADPAAGGGAFLLAAGRALVDRGLDPAAAAQALHGADVDPLAARVAEASVWLWSGGTRPEVIVADALLDGPVDEVDVVVGNPPFRSPLRDGGSPAGYGAYTDVAGLFLVRSCDRVRPGGRVALLQPQSVLAARDAEGVRRAVQQRAALRGLWVSEAAMFAAAVRVAAVVLERGGRRRAVRLYRGPDLAPAGTAPHPAPGTWAPLVARARGLPEVRLPAGPAVGSLGRATAGFRKQFYGLVGHVEEDGAGPRLVTAGLIDPARCAWGERPCRFAGQAWQRPTVVLDELEPALRAWVEARLVPKLVIATQTRVLEAAVDEDGTLVPSTPVIALEAPLEHLWDLAAVLHAPPVTAWLLARALGTGLSADAVRVTARQVEAIPLPSDRAAWTAATDALRAGDLERYGPRACRAYGVDEGLARWWAARRPGGPRRLASAR
jgi:hypothetical protein